MTFKMFLIYYAIGCLAWLIINLTIQMIRRKNLMKNWSYVNDFNEARTLLQMSLYPPLDGIIETILYNFIPLINLLYMYFICALSFAPTDSDVIIALQMAKRIDNEERKKRNNLQ